MNSQYHELKASRWFPKTQRFATRLGNHQHFINSTVTQSACDTSFVQSHFKEILRHDNFEQKFAFLPTHFTVRNSSREKVMFLQASASGSRGGGCTLPIGVRGGVRLYSGVPCPMGGGVVVQ